MRNIDFPGFETLNEEQKLAFVQILDYVMNGKAGDVLVLSAMGGAGKTYVLKMVRDFIQQSAFKSLTMAAYTGRAASLLDGGQTCHSLLFSPVLDNKGNLIKWARKSNKEILENCGIGIVVDEASMTPSSMHEQLLQIGIPLIYSGDAAQLPAIDQDNPGFNVMELDDIPRVELLTNMRIDPDSSGVFDLTMHLRENNSIPRKKGPGLNIVSKGKTMTTDFHKENQFDVVICGMNKTRKRLNKIIRNARGYFGETPEIGELVMCLKNTITGNTRINNGEIFWVAMVVPGQEFGRYVLTNVNNGTKVTVMVPNYTWDEETIRPADMGDEFVPFAFSYAVSCHKSQGGTFNNVLFIDEDVSFFLSQQKYRYTGVSRAAKQLTVAI